MYPMGLANTGILTIYAQKYPRSLANTNGRGKPTLVHYQLMDIPSWSVQIFNHPMEIRQ